MKILIVDDSDLARKFHSNILRTQGIETILAIDGSDGIEKFLNNEIDAILVDINMPNMDGYSMIERIREFPNGSNVPIIIITTQMDTIDKEKGFEAGANLFMNKPIEVDKLIENVNLLIS